MPVLKTPVNKMHTDYSLTFTWSLATGLPASATLRLQVFEDGNTNQATDTFWVEP